MTLLVAVFQDESESKKLFSVVLMQFPLLCLYKSKDN